MGETTGMRGGDIGKGSGANEAKPLPNCSDKRRPTKIKRGGGRTSPTRNSRSQKGVVTKSVHQSGRETYLE